MPRPPVDPTAEIAQCPLCSFRGTDSEIDDHRMSGAHHDARQAGSNKRGNRPRQIDPTAEIATLERKLAALRSEAGKPAPKEPRSLASTVVVKFTASEKARFRACATATGLPLTVWIRAACERAASAK